MAFTHGRSRRSTSGAYLRKNLKGSRHFASGRNPTFTKFGPRKVKQDRQKGGGTKTRLLMANTVNASDTKAKKTFKVKITGILENPASSNLVRRNILTKGTVVQTEKGKARITSRPGQEGTVSGVLLS